ncbi:unnamed protein product [Acanthosepion pharaonis]|uniref:Uncharacterized protein n=1 Tax=Acanthosepion pharaonis TaxID=158019 RepID=A0A812AV49_ACAPH|nr:unnamed protein product [Sepia pharaonis]
MTFSLAFLLSSTTPPCPPPALSTARPNPPKLSTANPSALPPPTTSTKNSLSSLHGTYNIDQDGKVKEEEEFLFLFKFLNSVFSSFLSFFILLIIIPLSINSSPHFFLSFFLVTFFFFFLIPPKNYLNSISQSAPLPTPPTFQSSPAVRPRVGVEHILQRFCNNGRTW